MYQITGAQKELYYKDFIKKPKNKFSSQWILQKAMVHAITKRQSKSYHVNKNDMQFCTQKQQLRDWQQNFQMYNQQAEIFKGRKKTDVQIQIELLKEYCLQLSGKDIQSPLDITQDDIRCLNADIDLFYKQASQYDPSKEETSGQSISQQIVSQFSQTINPQKSQLNPQFSVSSQKSTISQQNTRVSLKQNKLIYEEEDLGLNTHNLNKIAPSQYNNANQLTPFTMYDNQQNFNIAPVKTLNQQANQSVQSALQLQQFIQEQQKQIKHEIINSETIQYINVHNSNLNMDTLGANNKIECPKSEDLHNYLSNNNANIFNNQILEAQPQSYFTNGQSHLENMNQKILLQKNNGIQHPANNQSNSQHQTQIQNQQISQMKIKIEQQKQTNNLKQGQYLPMMQSQQDNRSNQISSLNQEQNQYIVIQKTHNYQQQQQMDSLYNIYNNQDTQLSTNQLKPSQNQCKKEYQDDIELMQSAYNDQNAIIQRSVNNQQIQFNNINNIQYQQNSFHNQIILDSELTYINHNKNLIKDNNLQKHLILQQIYDGNHQYVTQQKQFNNNVQDQVKNEEEATENCQQFCDQQDYMNQENPQDAPNDYFNYSYNTENNYHDYYINQMNNQQQLNYKHKESNQRNSCDIDLLSQQRSQINYYQMSQQTENAYDNNNNKPLQNQFDYAIEEEAQFCEEKPYNQILQHQSSLNNQYLNLNNSFGNDIQNIDIENMDNIINYNEMQWQQQKYTN